MTDQHQDLQRRIEHAVSGPVWHGSALRELLIDVTPAEAVARPIPGAHTIAELVAHVGAWAAIAERRLTTDTGETPSAEDWPAVDASSPAAWKDAIATLEQHHASLARAASHLGDEALAALVPGRKYAVTTMLSGVVEHAAYHGGQIALLLKAVRASRS